MSEEQNLWELIPNKFGAPWKVILWGRPEFEGETAMGCESR